MKIYTLEVTLRFPVAANQTDIDYLLEHLPKALEEDVRGMASLCLPKEMRKQHTTVDVECCLLNPQIKR